MAEETKTDAPRRVADAADKQADKEQAKAKETKTEDKKAASSSGSEKSPASSETADKKPLKSRSNPRPKNEEPAKGEGTKEDKSYDADDLQRAVRAESPAPVQDGPQPEYNLDEKKNPRPGPEENPDNKAFPDPATGTHPAPLARTRKDAKLEASTPASPFGQLEAHKIQPFRDGHAAFQEDQQWKLNREQADVTSSETPAGDSRPEPQATDSANWVNTPARAHTLSEPDDSGTADSVGQRLRRAAESARLEERPSNRGIHSDELPGAYTVEEELRLQWPGINLGDDEKE